MPRSSRPKQALVLRRDVDFRIQRAPFTTLASLRWLDVERLERAARARFEIGWFEAGCCRRGVLAHVERGRVTRLELEPCPESERPDREVRALVAAARKELAPRGRGGRRLPMPVGRFLGGASGLVIDVFGCFTICAFGYCIRCCFSTEDPSWNTCSIWEKTTLSTP